MPMNTISFETRVPRVLEGQRPSVIDAVASMGYAAYLEAVDAAVDGADTPFTVAELQRRWSVDPGVNMRRIAQFCSEVSDESDAIWLVDAFIVQPLSSLHRLAQAADAR